MESCLRQVRPRRNSTGQVSDDRNRFGNLHFDQCDLPFDLAQGGELVESFAFCHLLFGIFFSEYSRNLQPRYSGCLQTRGFSGKRMRIVQYCQHVLGVGHYFRSLEIARALHHHEIVLVTGGPPVKVDLPSHVTEYRLPGLQMNGAFTVISPTDANRVLHEVKEERKRLLYSLFEKNPPDLFLVELYPFGRKSFSFEILPVLEAIHRGALSTTKVVCSLRDILVEKGDQKTYEQRVVDILNKYFDGLLVHADETLVSLSETFESTDRIKIPLVYTGFIAPRAKPDQGKRVRTRLGLRDEALVVASAGGGRVGEGLLRAVVEAYARLTGGRKIRLCVFTGPFMAEAHFSALTERVALLPGVQ